MPPNKIKLRLTKTPQLPAPKVEDLKLLVKFITFAAEKLGISEKAFMVRLLHASPDEPVTTASYEPATDRIQVITQNRHLIDYCRSVAHEMVHQRQKYQNRVDGKVQEIGGDIEDEANAVSGQIVKEFIKNQLTDEQKKFLGLGTFR